MLSQTSIFLFSLFFISLCSSTPSTSSFNLTLPHQHPNPEAVVQQVQKSLNASISRRRQLQADSPLAAQCVTGNPIDDCWRCDLNWAAADRRQNLADCAIGFGRAAAGGKGGRYYVVTDSSDGDTVNLKPGTLRHAVTQDGPLWIVFQSSMVIKLRHELIFNSFKTVDGRGANVRITGNGCLTLQDVTNVIIHNVQIDNCVPSGHTIIRASPTHAGWRGKSDGDGISIFASSNIWIDHCTLAHCTDGLIDAIMASTAITISNCLFLHHNEVMLLGHNDDYVADNGMQVTIAFNHFGEGLVQRMPRCRRGYIHVVNNEFTEWQMYAIGGSANPTIISQGNLYTAPNDANAKEVTKRVGTDESVWANWKWKTDGDKMVNGAFFVPSGEGLSMQYDTASTIDAKSPALIGQMTMNAGVLPSTGDNIVSMPTGGGGMTTGTTKNNGGGDGSEGSYSGHFGSMVFGSDAAPTRLFPCTTLLLSFLIVLILYITTNHGGSLSLLSSLS